MTDPALEHRPGLQRSLRIAVWLAVAVLGAAMLLSPRRDGDVDQLLERGKYVKADTELARRIIAAEVLLGQGQEAEAEKALREIRDKAAQGAALIRERFTAAGRPDFLPGRDGQTAGASPSDERIFLSREAEARAMLAALALRRLEQRYAAEFAAETEPLFLLPAAECLPLLEEIRAAAGLDPSNKELRLLEGHLLDRFGEYPRALAALQAALDLDDHYAAAYNRRGLVYIKLRDFEKAQDSFEKAKIASGGQGPAYADSLFNLSRFHERLQAFHHETAERDPAARAEETRNRELAERYLREFLEQEKEDSPAAAQARKDLEQLSGDRK